MSTFTDPYARLMRHPLWVLLSIILFTAWLGSYMPQLKLDASSDSLVLEGDTSLEVYRQAHKTYGTSDFLLVTFSPHADLFSKQTRQHVAALRDELATLPGVDNVLTYLDVPLLYSPKVTLANFNDGVRFLHEADIDVDMARAEFLNSPVYKRLLTSQDESTTALLVNITAATELIRLRNARDELREKKTLSAEQKQQLQQLSAAYEEEKQKRNKMEAQLVESVRHVLDGYRSDTDIFLGGVPMIVSDMLDYVRSDMMVFGTAIMAFIVITLALIFRAARWVVLPLLTCLLTCVMMLGGIAFLGVKLTVISANFVALLLILTLSITIHLVVRFVEYEKEDPQMDQYTLVIKTMRYMVKPCTYTTLTTMVAFLSLIASGIRPVIDFGWMMTIAVATALTLSFFVLPAGLLLLPRRYHEKDDSATLNFTQKFAVFTEKYALSVKVLTTAIFLFSVAGIAQLKVENRFIDYFHKSTEIYQGMLKIDEELGGTLPLDVIINHEEQAAVVQVAKKPAAPVEDDFFGGDEFFAGEGDDFAATASDSPYALSYWFSRSGMQEVQKVHQYLDGLGDTGKILSLATLYEVVQDVAGGNVDDIQLALIKENLSPDIEKALVKPYLSADGKQTRISIRVMETSRSLNRAQMLKDIDRFLHEEMGYKTGQYQLTGMMVLYNNMLQSLFSSQITTLGAVFIAIMLMFALLFRSFWVSLIAIAPNVLAALFVLGCMGWLSIPLDIMTITIAAITVGIGVDDTIHYIHRFKKEFVKDRDYIATMYRCHGSIGRAMYYTSVTIIVGFSILALSNFTPSIYFGLLTGLAMFAALIGALVLLPYLLVTFKPLGKGI